MGEQKHYNSVELLCNNYLIWALSVYLFPFKQEILVCETDLHFG